MTKPQHIRTLLPPSNIAVMDPSAAQGRADIDGAELSKELSEAERAAILDLNARVLFHPQLAPYGEDFCEIDGCFIVTVDRHWTPYDSFAKVLPTWMEEKGLPPWKSERTDECYLFHPARREKIGNFDRDKDDIFAEHINMFEGANSLQNLSRAWHISSAQI